MIFQNKVIRSAGGVDTGTPFFLGVGIYAPHWPYEVPVPQTAKASCVDQKRNSKYYFTDAEWSSTDFHTNYYDSHEIQLP